MANEKKIQFFSPILYFFLLGMSFSLVFAGNFWHLTDMHHDPAYLVGSDPTTMCHTINISEPLTAGYFGDYLCDAPYSLLLSSLQFMNSTYEDPDFIIWTGDDPPHVDVSELSTEDVLNIISNATNLIFESFPNSPVFPTLGNHDYYPKGQMPPEPNEMYYKIGLMWKKWLSEEALNSFSLGGYYSMYFGNTNLRIAALNTVYYYTQDSLTGNMTDPAGQFEWLENLLLDARNKNDRVLITGHVPIGVFERAINSSWFYPNFNSKFIDLVSQFPDVIAGQLFAHQHSDSFRLIKREGRVEGAVMLIPSITPWKTTLEGVSANNPSVRLFSYSLNTSSIADTLLDFTQYFLDLNQANRDGYADWMEEYVASQVYGISSLSASNWNSVYQLFLKDDSFFQLYCKLNAVSYPIDNCVDSCKVGQLCGISESDYNSYYKCLNEISQNTTSIPQCKKSNKKSFFNKLF